MMRSFGEKDLASQGAARSDNEMVLRKRTPPEAEVADDVAEIVRRLDHIQATLDVLVRERTVKEYYATTEIAEILGKAEFTVRE